MTDTPDLVAEIEALGAKLAEAKASITKRFIGQETVVDLVLSSILCGGHGLLVGLPGLAKTKLVKTIGTVLGSMIEFAIPMCIFLGPKMHDALRTRDGWRPSGRHLKQLIGLGWPAGLQQGNEIRQKETEK